MASGSKQIGNLMKNRVNNESTTNKNMMDANDLDKNKFDSKDMLNKSLLIDEKSTKSMTDVRKTENKNVFSSNKYETLVDITNAQSNLEKLSSNAESETAYIDEYAFLEGRRVGKYRVTKSLGSGSSSRVKMGVCLDNGEKVAIKIVKRDYDDPESKKKKEERIYREVLISSLLSHPHIVRLKNFYFNENYFFLVFEYVKGVQLLDIVLENGALHESESRRYFRQILSAVSYIHENCIVHRDLKIENILIDEFGNVKILDFGLSNFFDYRRYLNTFCGSLYFAAPELLSGKRYIGPEIDIWSLGVVLYVLLHGRVPFDDKNLHNLHVKIKETKLELNYNLSAEAKFLLKGMISNNTTLRFDLQTVIDSEWVNMNYNTGIETFMYEREPIYELDEKLITILSLIAYDQFPMLKNEVQKYIDSINIKKNQEHDFWGKKPSIALYYLLKENFQNNTDSVDLQKSNTPKEVKDEKPESMHNFVNFLFAKEKENIFSKYFLGALFEKNDSSTFLPEKTISLKDEFTNDRLDDPINAPKIKTSFIKGVFNGINVRNLKCKFQLRKNMEVFFMINSINYEILERNYICSKGRNLDFCSFKISLYRNLVFGNFYLSVTKIAGDKAKYKEYYALLMEMAKQGVNYN